ncbi:hypothetical protein ACQEVC_12655 [Plantactinospora sp. CA-294935]|uniref:hypothetical protein n=1 Tax=Plantactinospora sp. CA-294935 TaxID=3240012 RepID=UPI003D8D428A
MTDVATAVPARHPMPPTLHACACLGASAAPVELRDDRHPTALLRVSRIYQSGFVRRSEHLPI